MKRCLAMVVFAATLLMPAAQADLGNSQGKGQSGSSGKDNHGQFVSECNHRANDRNLKGEERQDCVDWCTDSSERHGFYDWRWNDDRSCYQKADNKGLSGDQRRDFIRRCVDRNTDDFAKKSQDQGGDKNKDNDRD